VLFVVLALCAAGAAAAYRYWFTAADTPRFRLTKVERGSITSAVSATGTLSAVTTVQVGSQISGQIKEIHADFNTEVKKGQLIARIDPESFELKVNQAQADVEAAKTLLVNQGSNVLVLKSQAIKAKIQSEDARFDFERKRALAEKNFISGAERDKAQFAWEAAAEQLRTAEAQVKAGESQVSNAEAVVRQREAQLAQTRVDLDRTHIRAPVDGTVISRNVDAGQTVAASLQAPVLFTIAQDLRKMQVDVSIDEADVGRVRVGQAVTFTVDAYSGQTFRGQVSQIRKAAQIVQNVVTYTVVVGAENAELTLLPGMTANVRVISDTRRNVLKVSNEALRFRPRGTGDAAAGAQEGPGGGESPEARQKRLVTELKLNADQQARLKSIFEESRQKIMAMRDSTETPTQRRQAMARLRQESRNRIAEMLNPEQLARFKEMGEEGGGRGGTTAGRVFVVGDDGQPKEVRIRLGLTDGNATELVGEGLAEGAEIILGLADRPDTAARKSAAPALKL